MHGQLDELTAPNEKAPPRSVVAALQTFSQSEVVDQAERGGFVIEKSVGSGLTEPLAVAVAVDLSPDAAGGLENGQVQVESTKFRLLPDPPRRREAGNSGSDDDYAPRHRQPS
jgi:hypothetical protein